MNKNLLKLSLFIFGMLFFSFAKAAQPLPDRHITGGLVHSLFVDHDGNVWVWGGSSLANVKNALLPSIAMKNGRSVQTNFNSNTSFVIKQDGSLWGWGNTSYGQLGVIQKHSRTTSEFLDIPLKVMSDVIYVNGTGTIFAIRPDFSLWGWGHWGSHRGDSGKKDTIVPRKTLNDIVQVSSNRYHTLALQKDGTLWAWGDNQCGALGIGNRKEHVRPVKVNLKPLGKRKVARIAVRWGESYIVADDGTVWYSGEFNINQEECLDPPRLVPTQVAGILDVADIALGQYHELYLKKDGSVWVSGIGSSAGVSSAFVEVVPHKVMEGASEISAGKFHSVVLKKDGTVWTWGMNDYGQLGNGTTQNSSIPQQVRFLKP